MRNTTQTLAKNLRNLCTVFLPNCAKPVYCAKPVLLKSNTTNQEDPALLPRKFPEQYDNVDMIFQSSPGQMKRGIMMMKITPNMENIILVEDRLLLKRI